MSGRSGRGRRRIPRGRSVVGERFEGEVGPVAHGGHCVARVGAEQRVVFVRHAIPGEQVVLEVTEGTEGDRFWRADAVSVLAPSPDRVAPPCPYAGPDACGGCDFQHVGLARQRELKAEVIREQMQRLAGLEVEVVVEPVPGDRDGLGWRTRQRYVDLPGGARGMRKHRSHQVVTIDTCLIEGPAPSYDVRGRSFRVSDGGFWQVHPGGPEVLVETVLDFLAPQPGESALDLYAGVGLFAAFLGEAVGPMGGELRPISPAQTGADSPPMGGGGGAVTLVEGHRGAAEDAAANVPGARVLVGDVATVLAGIPADPVDLVVLDPPREGARRPVVEAVVARRPRAVAYVACDPAALARDVAIFAQHGYELSRLRAFDLFPMTHHVECVALLERVASP